MPEPLWRASRGAVSSWPFGKVLLSVHADRQKQRGRTRSWDFSWLLVASSSLFATRCIRWICASSSVFLATGSYGDETIKMLRCMQRHNDPLHLVGVLVWYTVTGSILSSVCLQWSKWGNGKILSGRGNSNVVICSETGWCTQRAHL